MTVLDVLAATVVALLVLGVAVHFTKGEDDAEPSE